MSRLIKALVIDDEPLARRGIILRLGRHRGFEVVAECGNGRQAAAAIRSLNPDVVFLDVQMPGADGFDLMSGIGASQMPLVVMITAHDQHAIRAFEFAVTDYLLKPLDDERFDAAVERVRQRLTERSHGMPPVNTSDAPKPRARFTIRHQGKIALVAHDDVLYVEAEGDYVRLHTRDDAYQMRGTLSAFAADLAGETFVRIHRSTLVNRHHVRELEPLPNREFTVVMTGGTRLRLSRSYSDQVNLLTAGAS